jgi:hypothetical protein
VQIVVTVAVLVALPSPVHSSMLPVVLTLGAAILSVALLARARTPGRAALSRLRAALARDLREALLARRAWPAIALASALVVAGHALTFLIAARTAGVTAPPSRILPIALLAMAAMVLPSVGGWGPREGVTAWAFGAAGLGAHRGVSTAVVYGVMVFVASLPGAVVLVVAWYRGTRRARRAQGRHLQEGAVHVDRWLPGQRCASAARAVQSGGLRSRGRRPRVV